jgi:hypothetical protein
MKTTKPKSSPKSAPAPRGLFGSNSQPVPSIPSSLDPLEQLKFLELDVSLGGLTAEQVAERAAGIVREMSEEIDNLREGWDEERDEAISDLKKDHASAMKDKDLAIKDVQNEIERLKSSRGLEIERLQRIIDELGKEKK